jgi:DNA-binding CsgD family transcriptional regulator
MRTWYEEKLKNFAEPSCSERELHDEISESVRSLNFDFWMFGIRLPVPFSNPATEVRGNCPQSWQEKYRAPRFLTSDPVLGRCLTSPVPLIWSAQACPLESRHWAEAKAHGMRFGWAMSMRGQMGTLSWLALARESGPLVPDESATEECRMIWLAHFVNSRMGDKLVPSLLRGNVPSLSSREREVMIWTAEGKTASEIGEILGIAESTCIFHLTNAARKLSAVNKAHAAARAAALGLIG